MIGLLISGTIPLRGAAAQDAPPAPQGDFSALRQTAFGRVEQVIDGTTILLKDKKIIRLPSLYILPDDDVALSAKETLARELPPGTEIVLYQTRRQEIGRLNRMGQILAHPVRKKDGVWIHGRLLETGMVLMMPSESNPEKTEDMRIAETIAIQKKFGLWARYPVLTPDNVVQALGDYRVVEGTVQKTAVVKNNLYLNFGHDWKTDFTVMITPEVRKKLARRNIDPLTFANKKIRVRGDIRSYNGPFIELTNLESLELFP